MTSIIDPVTNLFLAHSKEAVFIINLQHQVIAHSTVCQQLFGVGFHVGVSLNSDSHSLKLEPILINAIESGHVIEQYRLSLTGVSDSSMSFDVSCYPIDSDSDAADQHTMIWIRSAVSADTAEPVSAGCGVTSTQSDLIQLPNRFHLTHLLDQLTNRVGSPADITLTQTITPELCVPTDSFALLLLDLDRFKLINDTLGHQQGDLAVSIIGQRLQRFLQDEFVKSPHYLSHLGGDEFAVILTSNPSQSLVQSYSEAIMEHLSKPFQLDTREVFMTTSIGVSFFPQDGQDSHQLLKHAEIALYHAKAMGGFACQFYMPHAQSSGLERLELEADLRVALEKNEFEIDYQPQIELSSGQITGFEALIRWSHPTKGRLSPGIFIPILEETGLIDSVGDWLIEKACEQLKTLKKTFKRPFKMAVNLSARQFNSRHLLERTIALLSTKSIEPAELELEMTESLLMSRHENTLSTLQALALSGIKLSIDDFGTGYSSLAYLKRFPVDTLKINQSFIVDLERDQEDQILVKAIIEMAKSLNITVVAEGVETDYQYQFLTDQGCDIAQGFKISKPLLASELFDWIKCFQNKQLEANNQKPAPLSNENSIESVY